MGLRTYKHKRTFTNTPEPAGKKRPVTGKKLHFVVQEHHASRLHYDFRLEMDGVLKSWAVPKGPSMNPHDHHLAVHVEDHPYEYRNFEGVIPEGNYGAGNVIIWDAGTYAPRAETKTPEKTLLQELKDGHITFILHGKKLHGEFALIKLQKSKDQDAWLLIKKGDDYASSANILAQDTSVKRGKKVDDLGAHGKLPDLTKFPAVRQPWIVHPMLCTLVDTPFNDPVWLFEIKWDGYRAIASRSKHGVQVYSRNGTDFTQKFAPITEAVHGLKHDVTLDGEIVAVDQHGVPHFEGLQNWQHDPSGHLQYCVFDILWCDGRDVRALPLTERKKVLREIIGTKDPVLRYSDDVVGNGTGLFDQMQAKGLEGIVAKRAASTYQEAQRGQDWLKIKTHLRQEVVIGGFTEPRGSRTYLGSLLTGVYEKGQLKYAGHSGGGIADAQRKTLREKLNKLERKTSPFANVPEPSDIQVHWVKPELVCEMDFSEWTSEGLMRQPKYVGMRIDKQPQEVRHERPDTRAPHQAAADEGLSHGKNGQILAGAQTTTQSMPAHNLAQNGGLPFELTHQTKIFFPRHKYTKGDLIKYYENAASYILPYLKDRPLSLLRQPGGVNDRGFFQKNMPHAPAWLPTADIYSDTHQGNMHWMVGGSLETLLYAVQLGSIEINPWSSRVTHLNNPDWAVIDLDPEGTITFKDVIAVARTVKQVCQEWHVPSYPKTSGKTGIHIFIPMGARYTYEQVKDFAHLMVLEVHRRQPNLTSVERMPGKRPNRIYLDFLQNRQGQTLAAPYSVRPTPDATVSMPLHWDEVTASLKPTDFTIENAMRRVSRIGDLWAPVLGKGVDLRATLAHIKNVIEP